MNTIPTKEQYERNERTRYYNERAQLARAPLADRQDGRDRYLADLRDNPEIIGERVAWLLDGSYGKGAYDVAREIADNPRMNRAAALGQMIAGCEWMATDALARDAWSRITGAQQRKVTDAINRAIKQYEADRDEK
jgi:hypothetical protein